MQHTALTAAAIDDAVTAILKYVTTYGAYTYLCTTVHSLHTSPHQKTLVVVFSI